jgi:carbonic anhydrase
MGPITRRRFAGVLGLVAAGGIISKGSAQSHAKEHPAPPTGPAPAKPKLVAAPKAAPAPAPKAAAPAPASPVHVFAPPAVDRSTASPEEIWQDLVVGNKRFAEGKSAGRDVIAARAKTAPVQHPYVMVLCCADSRLSPELIFDQNIGDLFVVRTAGNVADPIALGSLEYAVEHLGSRMLVVLGHERCGAVSATLSGEAMPTENLAALVKKIKPGIEKLKGLVQGETLMDLAVEANVHHSAADCIKDSPIIRHEVARGSFTVAKAVYNLATGQVRRLGGNFDTSEDKGAASTH